MGVDSSKPKNGKYKADSPALKMFTLFNISDAKTIKKGITEKYWSDKTSPKLLARLLRFLYKNTDAIPLEQFVDFYKTLVDGSSDDKANITFKIITEGETVTKDNVKEYFLEILSTIYVLLKESTECQSWRALNGKFNSVESLVSFAEEVAKTPNSTELGTQEDFRAFYRKNEFFNNFTDYVYQSLYEMGRESRNFLPRPMIESKWESMLNFGDVVFLNFHLPRHNTISWRFLYSMGAFGGSWVTLCSRILRQGPTLVVIEDESGHIFGGFASSTWNYKPNFYGDENCFLFSLKPTKKVFEPTGYNKNFQYINTGATTLPNGMGWGGTLEYWGLFLDSEFGRGTAASSCTTYKNYKMLSAKRNFEIKNLEVWGVGERDPTAAELGERPSGGNLDPTAAAFLEMAGKKLYSKDIRLEKSADEMAKLEGPCDRTC